MPPVYSQLRGHGSEGDPIAFLSDDEGDVPQQYADVRNIIRQVRDFPHGGRTIIHIDEDAPADDEDEQTQNLAPEYEIETEDDVEVQQVRPRRGQIRISRNPPLHGSHRTVPVLMVNGVELKLNTVVELFESLDICRMMTGDDDLFSPVDAQFVEIKSIWVGRNNVHDTIIRGLPYTRNRNIHGRLEAKKNEVCRILEVDDDDERPDEEQALVEIRPEQIMTVRTLITTNKSYTRERRDGFDPAYSTWQMIEDHAPLTCRWKMRVNYRDATKRRAGYSYGGALSRFAEADVEKRRHRVLDKELREAWRGPSRPSGKYTFGDMFCGAGGVSRGATMAGLDVKLAVDHWPIACQSYRRNFPDTLLDEKEITDFIHNDIDHRSHPIDILHLSPPCQYFSPLAYVRQGRNDLRNLDVLFSCPDLINKLRPRAFALEETFGITHQAHAKFFNALIQGFTCHGYSVEWQVVCFRDYSLPSRRLRLIINGACPGETLPPFPSPTHSAAPARGQSRWVTERQAIGHLRPGVTDLHDVAGARAANAPPRDGNTPLGATLTCAGVQSNHHFSGRRAYTLRELACLQGFPVAHRFVGNMTAVRRQIGNAFSPCVARVFLGNLRRHFERVDGVRPARGAPLHPRPGALLPDTHSADGPSSSGRGRRGRVYIDLETQRDVEPRFEDYNGDLAEDEALEAALQESRNNVNGARNAVAPDTRRRSQQDFIDLLASSDDDEAQESSIGRHVTPLMGRMSIASPRTLPHPPPCHVSPGSSPQPVLDLASRSCSATPLESNSRSRSATLDFSPGPSQKRPLEVMHGGAEDQVMKKESPEKRERLVDEPRDVGGQGDDYVIVVDAISSRLPGYRRGRPQGSSDADGDEYVVLDRPSRSTSASMGRVDQDTNADEGLIVGDHTSFKGAVEKQRSPTSITPWIFGVDPQIPQDRAYEHDEGWTF